MSKTRKEEIDYEVIEERIKIKEQLIGRGRRWGVFPGFLVAVGARGRGSEHIHRCRVTNAGGFA